MTSSHFSKGRNCRTGGFPVHSHPRDEEPVQLLLFTFAGLDVHTSDVSGEGVQLDPQAVHQLLLQGRHQQGPNHSYCKCSAFARAKRQTTNANMILFKRVCNLGIDIVIEHNNTYNLHELESLTQPLCPPRRPAEPSYQAASQSRVFFIIETPYRTSLSNSIL